MSSSTKWGISWGWGNLNMSSSTQWGTTWGLGKLEYEFINTMGYYWGDVCTMLGGVLTCGWGGVVTKMYLFYGFLWMNRLSIRG